MVPFACPMANPLIITSDMEVYLSKTPRSTPVAYPTTAYFQWGRLLYFLYFTLDLCHTVPIRKGSTDGYGVHAQTV